LLAIVNALIACVTEDSEMRIAPKRRWVVGSLVLLLAAMTTLGFLFAYQARWVRQRSAFVSLQRAELRKLGYDVNFFAKSNRKQAPGLTWLVGEKGFEKLIVCVEQGQNGQEVERAKELFPEATFIGTWGREERTFGRYGAMNKISEPPATVR
jgi:hypothetical protein